MELQSLGRYQIRGRIGRGTMGVVYRGYDPVLDREIALKTVDLSPAIAIDEVRRERFLARFFQEAKIAARLLHPGIVVTHDAATDEATGTPFIAMELVTGGSLADRIAAEQRLGWRDGCRLAAHLARALDYAHRQGVVHRDVKPANVLLSSEGVAKIADFGIARLNDSSLTQTGAVVGTPFYMSPEQLEADEVDGRSDLFSLGALLYTVLVGGPPFAGNDIASITRAVLYKDPSPPSESVREIPPSVDGVVARALAKPRDERYATGDELADDLERVLRGEEPSRPLSLGERTVEHVPNPVTEPPTPTFESGSAPPPSSASSSALARRLFLLVVLAGAVVYAGVRRPEIARFLSSRISAAAATIREDREDRARRQDLSARAARRLDEARDLTAAGRWEEASAALEQGLRSSREAKDGTNEATALLLRGKLAADVGDWSKARSDLESASSVYEIYGNEDGRALALVELGNLERDLGELDRAEALYERAGGTKSAEATHDLVLGRAVLALLRGDAASAEAGFRSLVEADAPASERAQAALYLGALAWTRGDAPESETWWGRAAELTDPREVDLYRGFALLGDGRAEEATPLFETALSYFQSKGRGPAAAAALDGLSGTTGDNRLATVLLGEPRTRRSESRWKLLPATVP